MLNKVLKSWISANKFFNIVKSIHIKASESVCSSWVVYFPGWSSQPSRSFFSCVSLLAFLVNKKLSGNNEYGFDRLIFFNHSYSQISLRLYCSLLQVQLFQTQFYICGWNVIPIRRELWLAKRRAPHTHTHTHTHTHPGTCPFKPAQSSSQAGLASHTQANTHTCNLFSLNHPSFSHSSLKPWGSPSPPKNPKPSCSVSSNHLLLHILILLLALTVNVLFFWDADKTDINPEAADKGKDLYW